MHGAGDYHLQPKQPTAAGGYSDFSLGFFGPAGGISYVHAELKGYRQCLDKPMRSGAHRGISPVEQAFNAVEGDPAEWVLVSNFDAARHGSNSRVGASSAYKSTSIMAKQ